MSAQPNLSVIDQLKHTTLWRGDQMASYQIPTISSGFSRLDAELPQAGWPYSTLIELLIQQAGIGEIQLLKPALVTLAHNRHIVFIQPPHPPQIATFQAWNIPLHHLIWIKNERANDALWAAEQILRNGSCGAVLLWQSQIHPNALRRLQLAAQEANTMCWVIRPLAKAQEASPAPLRLALRPALGGMNIDLIKRRGPLCAESFHVALPGACS